MIIDPASQATGAIIMLAFRTDALA